MSNRRCNFHDGISTRKINKMVSLRTLICKKFNAASINKMFANHLRLFVPRVLN